MKIAALFSSLAALATAVLASDVTIKYCVDEGECMNALAPASECLNLEHPGLITTISNNAKCILYENDDCTGRNRFIPRGKHNVPNYWTSSIMCFEPRYLRQQYPVKSWYK
ncbi:hypothetical protein EC968_006424 [Mortierella alpina]|nr:hypothetical protein EC968_006424 [Mortierella alpina]